MKRVVLAVISCVVGAGCSSEPSYTVNHNTLTVHDSGYVSTDGRYCEGAGPGQFRLVFVDYSPICGQGVAIDADGGARSATVAHNELELIFVTTDHNPMLPYPVAVPDCTNGPAGPGIATFSHFDINSDTPDATSAVGGQMYLTFVDPTGDKPALGSFDLDFGTAGKIKGDFKTYTCN